MQLKWHNTSTTNKSAWRRSLADRGKIMRDRAGGCKRAERARANNDTYVGVRRGDRAAQAGVRRRRHLVVHVVPVAHVVAGTGTVLDVPSQLQLELPRRLHERVEAGGRAPRRARASARCECGPGPGAGRTCATPPASPPPAWRAPPYTGG